MTPCQEDEPLLISGHDGTPAKCVIAAHTKITAKLRGKMGVKKRSKICEKAVLKTQKKG